MERPLSDHEALPGKQRYKQYDDARSVAIVPTATRYKAAQHSCLRYHYWRQSPPSSPLMTLIASCPNHRAVYVALDPRYQIQEGHARGIQRAAA